MSPRRVWTSTARRPYADQQMLAAFMGLSIVGCAAFAFVLGYYVGAGQ